MIGAKVIDIVYMVGYSYTDVVPLISVLLGKVVEVLTERLAIPLGGCLLYTSGILTDRKEHTPQRIAQRMLDYGYDNYRALVGEHLGNRERQQLYCCLLYTSRCV